MLYCHNHPLDLEIWQFASSSDVFVRKNKIETLPFYGNLNSSQQLVGKEILSALLKILQISLLAVHIFRMNCKIKYLKKICFYEI